jgi:mRNA interferase MazF
MPYSPRQGDIVMVDFNPQTGHEQKGRRPGLVVSNAQFHLRTNMTMICPITNTISGFPTHIVLDSRTKTTGAIMCEQAKCLDIMARNATLTEAAPDDITDEAIDLICSFIE